MVMVTLNTTQIVVGAMGFIVALGFGMSGSNTGNPNADICSPAKGAVVEAQVLVDNIVKKDGQGRRLIELREVGTNCSFSASTSTPMEIGKGYTVKASYGDEFWNLQSVVRNSANEGTPVLEVPLFIQEIPADDVVWTSQGAVDISKVAEWITPGSNVVFLVRDGKAVGIK